MQILKRTVYIGLGGAGIQSIIETKKQFIEQFGEVPSIIQFLGIDTDKAEFEKKGKDDVTLDRAECCHIGITDPSAFYKMAKDHLEWMPASNAYSINMAHSGQIRTNGRLAFVANHDKISFALNQAFQKAIYAAPNADLFIAEDDKVRFYIVFSLAGGTGSGCFIDLAYMILGRFSTNIRDLIGFAILPDIYKDMVPNGPGMTRVCSNAYAALKELDYLMHLTPNSEPFTLDWMSDFYNETSFIRNPNPFSWVYLIGNKNGKVVIDSPAQLYKLIGRALFMTCGRMGSNIEANIDNIINYALENGLWASSFGLSSVVYNGQDSADVFTLRLSLEIIRNLLTESSIGDELAVNMFKDGGIYKGGYYENFLDLIGSAKQAFSPDFIKNKKNACEEVMNVCSNLLNNYSEKAERYCKGKGNMAVYLKSEVTRCLQEVHGGISAAEIFLKETIRLSADIVSKIHLDLAVFEERKSELKKELDAASMLLEEEANKNFFSRRASKIECLQNDVRLHAEKYLANELEIKRRQYAMQVMDSLQQEAKGDSAKILQVLLEILKNTQTHFESELNKSGGIGTETELARFLRSLDLSDNEPLLDEFLKTLDGNGLEGISNANDFETALKEFAQKQWFYKHYQKATLPEAIETLSKEAVSELFYQAMDKSRALIQYDLQWNKPFVSGSAHRILGVENVQNSPFVDATEELCNENHIWKVSTGLKYLILFFSMETPFPIEYIDGMRRWKKEYDILEEKQSSHIDIHLKERILNEK